MTWKVERTPGRPLHRTEDNRFALPLRLTRTGDQPTDTTLTLTPAEAEHLHAALCRALDGQPAPPSALDCRSPVQTSPGTSHIMGRA
ncbi:hypothetical protein [Streptomyces sp. NBC_00576]|uniref:hypothetical protein n=1 Tax=Streptomyces sp. NBC_00576 TaxID=2903665 RepID=UPI002E8072E6|nr:hypothetical protein [Streptomyces sp. NBC_00576]WUB71101.1 hypothetical protein OG734_13940 [Streptomyces sp. NBC_00576]